MFEPPSLFELPKFEEKHPAFSVNSLRWLRSRQGENGFGPAFVKVGSRLFVNEQEFFAAIDRQNGRSN
jgi:hypothetical protein